MDNRFYKFYKLFINNAKKISVYTFGDIDTEKTQILAGWPTVWSRTPCLIIKAGTFTRNAAFSRHMFPLLHPSQWHYSYLSKSEELLIAGGEEGATLSELNKLTNPI